GSTSTWKNARRTPDQQPSRASVRRAGPWGEPGFPPRFLLVAYGIVHEAVLYLVQDVHGRRDRAETLDLGSLGFDFGLLDQPVDRHGQLRRNLALIGEVQHLQLVEQPIDVPHLVPASVLFLTEPPVAF